MRFHFYSCDADAVSQHLDHGNLDFAVMLEPVDNVKYDFLSLPDTSEWGILMLKSDPLANQLTSITKETLRMLPLIMHQRIGLQNEIAHWAEIDLEDLTIATTYNVIHGSPIPFVTHGLGYLLTTHDLLDPVLDESVCFLPLAPALPTKTALVWKKTCSIRKSLRGVQKYAQTDSIDTRTEKIV